MVIIEKPVVLEASVSFQYVPAFWMKCVMKELKKKVIVERFIFSQLKAMSDTVQHPTKYTISTTVYYKVI